MKCASLESKKCILRLIKVKHFLAKTIAVPEYGEFRKASILYVFILLPSGPLDISGVFQRTVLN